ncbi:MAG: fused MFS/spermidine synthase [Hyphomonadaceae bacterium]|nr:fused MFS/spermidine synthase [Hyphomonadaceae bacterium]
MNTGAIAQQSANRSFAMRVGASPYIATIFLSAALVFLVQPIFAKMATPLLGGAPNVWNVSLVCFQAALLLGYAYAHLLTRFVDSLRAQIGVHAALLALAALVLPFQLSTALGPPDPVQPTFWLIGVFAISIAPPFAVISATAPLIQSWYSRSGRADAHDPYHLYAASNVGSLLGLAAYPLLFEPFLPVLAQTSAWTVGYLCLALLLVGCGLLAFMTGRGAHPAVVADSSFKIDDAATNLWQQRLWWLVCAFIPSSLLVGSTTHIATEIASVPFLWALPLALYISSFVIVFAKQPAITLDTSNRLLPMTVALAFFALAPITVIPVTFSVAIHVLALFVAALVGHGTMAASRPAANRLTEFYLIMSLGGVLGGAFNALLVPVLFTSVIEYPLLLVAILAIRPGLRLIGKGRTRVWLVAALITLAAASVMAWTQGPEGQSVLAARIFLLLAALGVAMSWNSKLGPVIAALCAWGVGAVTNPIAGGVSDRSFFGVVKLIERGDIRHMMHSGTVHGTQFMTPNKALMPTTYYAPPTPIGRLFAANNAPGAVGVVGLGTGSVACYAQPGQDYVYYEIDPLVADIASDPQHFSYLSTCTPNPNIVLGDGRLSLANEPENHFNLLLIDAFSSSSVPTHLLTREAVSLYVSRLSENGLLVMHVSNNHMDLPQVVARVAGSLGIPARYQYFNPTPDEAKLEDAHASQVVVLARSEAALAALDADPDWTVLTSDGGRPWSDDYTNVIGAILEKRG